MMPMRWPAAIRWPSRSSQTMRRATSPATRTNAISGPSAGVKRIASLSLASLANERLAIRLTPAEGPEIAFVLVAGLVARRIVCELREGQRIAAGQRIGIIRFGSRVDVYCPPPYLSMVVAGQRMVGGETVIADRLARDPVRQGSAH